MTSPLRQRILAALDVESELFSVPEWDHMKIEIRGLDLASRGKVLRHTVGPDGNRYEDFWASIAVATVHDPDTGERIFDEADIPALVLKSAAVMERIGKNAIRISGINEDAVDTLGKVSSVTPSDAPSSS